MKSAFQLLIVTAAIELLTCTAAPAQEQGPTVAVGITAPANGAVVTAGGDVEISAAVNINRRNWAIVEVTFYADTQLIGTATAAPYRVIWTGVPAGRYLLTAKAVATNAGQGKQDAGTHRNMPTWEGVSTPVNLIVNESASPAHVYYIHTDHLNTPRLITNEAGQAAWRWDQMEPFGNNPVNENPSGLGNFTCNLRFPGQYFDKETNLHYNYFRDYDPAIGRYIQSDPIGLAGGMNTYAYAQNNPLSNVDPYGLESMWEFFANRPTPTWRNMTAASGRVYGASPGPRIPRNLYLLPPGNLWGGGVQVLRIGIVHHRRGY